MEAVILLIACGVQLFCLHRLLRRVLRLEVRVKELESASIHLVYRRPPPRKP
ncbi:hypothetical protein D3C79_354520 [compost metagenome]